MECGAVRKSPGKELPGGFLLERRRELDWSSTSENPNKKLVVGKD